MIDKEIAGEDVNSRLRILAIHRYYWPDSPPYASMLRRIVASWCEQGHQVDILSSQPSYKASADNHPRPRCETVDSATVNRLTLPSESGRPFVRLLNALRLSAAIIYTAVVKQRYDVIMVSTSPPVVAGFVVAFAAKLTKARFVYHCMDIHPEIGRISGEFGHPFVFNTLLKLDSWSCRQADPVVVLSKDMELALRERAGGENLRIQVINNFSLPDDEHNESGDVDWEYSGNKFILLFAGNVGRFQGLETLVEAMGQIKHRADIEAVIMGDGAAKKDLQSEAERIGARVRFVGLQPVQVAKQAMKQADVGFVSLVPGLYKFAYPSKTMTYLEQGCPLLAAVEAESQLARDVVENNLGCVVPNGCVSALSGMIQKMADKKNDLLTMRDSAKEFSEEVFLEQKILSTWARLIDK
jgi:glycosyltransferase involved in cell wall biosynthesis